MKKLLFSLAWIAFFVLLGIGLWNIWMSDNIWRSTKNIEKQKEEIEFPLSPSKQPTSLGWA